MENYKNIRKALINAQNELKEFGSIEAVSDIDDVLANTLEDFKPVNVLVLNKGLIEENFLVNGGEKAEELFLDECSHHISNWDEHTDEDIETILENGQYDNLAGVEIVISHPEVKE